MSQVDELLDGLTDEQIAEYSANAETEPHIVIGEDRFIKVPDELKRLAVQYDHNVETVTFDCPRFWDEHDMSKMVVYINYKLPNNYNSLGSYIADDVTVDENDENIMHFNWTISRNVTQFVGNISFLICIKKTDEEGNETNHWNSELCQDCSISQGMECDVVAVEENPDIITQLLVRMDTTERNIQELISTTEEDVQELTDSVENLIGAAREALDDKDVAWGVANQNGGGVVYGWSGTKEEYEEQKDNLHPNTFAILEDDDTLERLTAAIGNKAPAGYGLGTQSTWIADDVDIDTLVDCGWYSYFPTNTSTNKPFVHGGIFVLARGDLTDHQIYFYDDQGNIVDDLLVNDNTCTQLAVDRWDNLSTLKFRLMTHGKWSEWKAIATQTDIDGLRGDIAELDANKAPAGYGLGGSKGLSSAELDNFYSPGWFHIDGEMTIGGVKANYWFGHNTASGGGSNHSAQHIRAISGRVYNELERVHYHGEWKEWEWTNPPMVPGTEYRTTKRHNNKTVYVKRIVHTLEASLQANLRKITLVEGVTEIVSTKLNYVKDDSNNLIPLYASANFEDLSLATGNISRAFACIHLGEDKIELTAGNMGKWMDPENTSDCTISLDLEYTKD